MNSTVEALVAAIAPTPYPNQSLRNILFDTTRNLNGLEIQISDNGNDSSALYNSTDLPDKYTKLSELSRNCVIVYCVIFLVAATANLTVFLSVCHQLDKLKWRITILILHLAIADLIVTFFVIPMEIFWRLTIGWIGGNALCKICQFGRAFGLYLSSNILICISMDRFFAIIFPLRMANAAKRVKSMIIAAWVMAALSSLPQSFVFQVKAHPVYTTFHQCVSIGFFQSDLQEIMYNVFSVTAMFFFPLIVIIFTYGMILWKITTKSHEHKQKKNQNFHGGTGNGNCHLGSSDAAALLVRAKKRTLRLTLVIVMAFILCGSPYAFITLWYMFDKEGAKQLDPALQDALFMMVVANSCVNPIIYGRYTKKTLGKFICPCSLVGLRGRAPPVLVSQQEDELDHKRTSDIIAVTSVI
ncbi:unnamed protein product [Orchesella dallaii]|uniref:G-protein coupled receptors family 1 profile domain-containing protein n=1 Tax=Orchesella dallaii TaxID=48710 RepID=A0ABP1QEV4_9HEXA